MRHIVIDLDRVVVEANGIELLELVAEAAAELALAILAVLVSVAS